MCSFELFVWCVFKLCVGLGGASSFVCAWVSCFGFAFAGFAADLGAGVSGSARCALEAAKDPTFVAALVVDGRYLCAYVACVGLSWFGRLVRVDLGWIVGLSNCGWTRCVVV